MFAALKAMTAALKIWTAAGRAWFQRHRQTLAVMSLIVVGLVIYANALPNGLFWDDYDYIINNSFIKDWHHLPQYFSRNIIAGAQLVDNYWRPMNLLTFSFGWHLWKDWAAGFHFINIAVHVSDAVLLYYILSRLVRDRRLAWFTALIFLVHPLQTEAVTYVSGLGDPLSVLFILLGLNQYLKWRESGRPPWTAGRYWLTCACYALALMTKETAIILPALLALADFYRANAPPNRPDWPIWKRQLKDVAVALAPFLILAGLYVLLRATALNFLNTFNFFNEANEFTSHFSYRLFTFFRVLAVYAQLLFVPLGLHMERTVEVARSFFAPDVLAGAAVFLGLLAAAVTQFRRRPIVSFGCLWFLIGLAPTSNLAVPINGLVYEHWLYLPLIGIFLVLTWFGLRLADRRPIWKWPLLAVGAAFIFWLMALTMARNPVWRGPITFYHDVLRYNQKSYRIYNNLGNAYADAQNAAEAENAYRRAIALDPTNPVAYFNLANGLNAAGQTEEAISNYRKAVELDPGAHFYANGLTEFYLRLGRRAEAKQVLENFAAKTVNKNNALIPLAILAVQDGDYEAALKYLEQAEAADPTDGRVANLRSQILSLPTAQP